MHEMESQNPEQKQKRYSLDKRVAVYKESRVGLAIVLSLLVIIGTAVLGLAFFNVVGGTILVFLVIGLPGGAIAALLWFLAERLNPRKYLVVYEGGLQFVSRLGTEDYPWEDISSVKMTVVKVKETDEIWEYKYTFKKPTGPEVLGFNSRIYPGLKNGAFSQMLKRLHLDSRLTLETSLRWIRNPDNDGL